MRIETFRQRLADLGAKPVHVQRMLRAWLHALPLDAGPTRRGPALPRAVVDALPALREAAPRARVLMLTVSEDGDDLAAALRGGACGYLLKTIEGDELTSSIRRAMRGDSVVSPEMTGKLVAAFRGAEARSTNESAAAAAVEAPTLPASPLARLSPRELDILHGIARGDSNKEIARELAIAETTVKIHVQHILRKLGLTSRVQAAVLATEHGLS